MWLITRNMQNGILDDTGVGNGDGSLGLSSGGTKSLDLLDKLEVLDNLTCNKKAAISYDHI